MVRRQTPNRPRVLHALGPRLGERLGGTRGHLLLVRPSGRSLLGHLWAGKVWPALGLCAGPPEGAGCSLRGSEGPRDPRGPRAE